MDPSYHVTALTAPRSLTLSRMRGLTFLYLESRSAVLEPGRDATLAGSQDFRVDVIESVQDLGEHPIGHSRQHVWPFGSSSSYQVMEAALRAKTGSPT
jgi:hypothetical protein